MYWVFNIAKPHSLDQYKTSLWLQPVQLYFTLQEGTYGRTLQSQIHSILIPTLFGGVWPDPGPCHLNPRFIRESNRPRSSVVSVLDSLVGRRSDFSGDSYFCNTVVPVAKRSVLGERTYCKENYRTLNKILLFTPLFLKSSPNSLYKESGRQKIGRLLSSLWKMEWRFVDT